MNNENDLKKISSKELNMDKKAEEEVADKKAEEEVADKREKEEDELYRIYGGD